jgi:hypothetical protein
MTAFRSLISLASLLLISGCGVQGGSSSGSCAAPRAALSAQQASPGDGLTVTVSYRVACKDTDPGDVTVIDGHFQAVKIFLVQRDKQTMLATVNTDQEGHLSTRVTIPASAQTGDAFVRVDYADDAFLTIR